MAFAGGLEFVHCLLEQVLKRCLIGSVSQCVCVCVGGGGRRRWEGEGIFIDVVVVFEDTVFRMYFTSVPVLAGRV